MNARDKGLLSCPNSGWSWRVIELQSLFMGLAESSSTPHSVHFLPLLHPASCLSRSVNPVSTSPICSQYANFHLKLFPRKCNFWYWAEWGLVHGRPIQDRRALGTCIWSKFKCLWGWCPVAKDAPLAPLPSNLFPEAAGTGKRERCGGLGKLLGRRALFSWAFLLAPAMAAVRKS